MILLFQSLIRSVLYLPGDYIIERGDKGECMYIIDNGSVEIILNKNMSIVLEKGAYFGEVII